jgi:uncharacterized protein (UPF0333 family)
MKKYSQKGFGHLGLLLLVVVVAIIGLAGYKVAKNHSDNSKLNSSTGAAATAQLIPTIKNTADLKTAETTLNSQNVDGDLNPDSLNQDVSSLL